MPFARAQIIGALASLDAQAEEALHLAEQAADALGIDAVEQAPPVAPALDQPRLAEELRVDADGGVRQIQVGGDVRVVDLGAADDAEHGQPGWVGERLQPAGDVLGPRAEGGVQLDGDVQRVVIEAGSADARVVGVEGLAGARVVERTWWRDQRPEVNVNLTNGELFVEADCEIRMTVGAACSVELTVEVPMDVAVSAVLSSGDVTATNLSADVIEIAVGSGDIDVEQTRVPEMAWLEAGSGDLRLVVPKGAYDVTTSSSSGDVSVSGVQDSAAADSTLDLHTSTGDITLIGR